jgi:hypothetical protein
VGQKGLGVGAGGETLGDGAAETLGLSRGFKPVSINAWVAANGNGVEFGGGGGTGAERESGGSCSRSSPRVRDVKGGGLFRAGGLLVGAERGGGGSSRRDGDGGGGGGRGAVAKGGNDATGGWSGERGVRGWFAGGRGDGRGGWLAAERSGGRRARTSLGSRGEQY